MKKNNQTGFTLLETMVAIFILSLSITGPIYISSVAYRNTIDSRDNISAQYLAEEVVEAVRNTRDANMLDAETDRTDWLTKITGTVDCYKLSTPNNRCIMERNPATDSYIFQRCLPNSGCPHISFHTTGKIIYGNSTINPTSKFIREFYLDKGDSDPSTGSIPDREMIVTVNIKWEDRGKTKIYTLKETLYAIDYAKFFTQ